MNERESPEQLQDHYERGFGFLIVVLSLVLFWYFAGPPAWRFLRTLWVAVCSQGISFW